MEGSSSRSGRNREAAVEADTIGEQQLKRGAAAEADANRGAAALHRELSGAGLLTQANEGEVAERAKLLVMVIIVHRALLKTSPLM